MTGQKYWANIGWRSAMRDRLFAECRLRGGVPGEVVETIIASAPAWVDARTKESLRQAAVALRERL